VHIDWNAIGKVVIAGLVAGVGTVVIFSLGMAALGHRVTAISNGGKGTLASTLAWCCFAACVTLLGLGLYLVIAGG
jgi:hypothetical protein